MLATLPTRPLVAIASYLSAAAIWGAGATALPLRLGLDPAGTIWFQTAAWAIWLVMTGGIAAVTLARMPEVALAFSRVAATDSPNDALHCDLLTGLPGRALLRERLEAAGAHARRSGHLAALLFVDLDRFKSVNDSHGHSLGDNLLRLVARRAAACIRETDSIARLEGDAFAIVAVDLEGMEAVDVLAERLRAALGQPFRIGEIELTITASVGIAVFSGDDGDPDRLLHDAENALYRAKEQGRNTHAYFVTEMTATTQRRARLEGDLRLALEREGLTLHYQPKIDLATGRITGVEALARWKHPEQGWISPGEFIPVAEECGLILPVGKFVLRRACRDLKAWHEAGLPQISVAVNFSPNQFRDSDLAREVAQVLVATGLEGRFLEVELTESAILRDPERVQQALAHLRSLGVKVALDDFGTGYSSLSYLKRLPIDKLKVDRAFVSGLDKDSSDVAIVGAVIALGRSLNLEVVAEGVESDRVSRMLRQMGCAEAQGYYFSPPVAADQLKPLLKAGYIHPVASAAE